MTMLIHSFERSRRRAQDIQDPETRHKAYFRLAGECKKPKQVAQLGALLLQEGGSAEKACLIFKRAFQMPSSPQEFSEIRNSLHGISNHLLRDRYLSKWAEEGCYMRGIHSKRSKKSIGYIENGLLKNRALFHWHLANRDLKRAFSVVRHSNRAPLFKEMIDFIEKNQLHKEMVHLGIDLIKKNEITHARNVIKIIIDRCHSVDLLNEVREPLRLISEESLRDAFFAQWVKKYCHEKGDLDLIKVKEVIDQMQDPFLKKHSLRYWHLANRDPESALQYVDWMKGDMILEFTRFGFPEFEQQLRELCPVRWRSFIH